MFEIFTTNYIGEYSGLRFSLKQWNPLESDGIIFEIVSRNKTKSFNLTIGASENEKVMYKFRFSIIDIIMENTHFI